MNSTIDAELRRLQNQFNQYCVTLNSSEHCFQTGPTHDGSPHVEIEGDTYHFVVTERGSEYERRTTKDSQQLLYWLIEVIVFDLACGFELVNREPGADPRRILFKRQRELFATLGEEWVENFDEKIAKILRRNPFVDSLEDIDGGPS